MKTTPIDVVAEARAEYEQLHDLPDHRPRRAGSALPGESRQVRPLQRLKRAMDEWCAVWFWPMDEESCSTSRRR